jgi:hypothetical protein
MDEQEFTDALKSLDELSEKEYQAGMSFITAAAAQAPNETLGRLGRLVGVLMKEPFAEPVDRQCPSQYTGALRSWELRPREQLALSVIEQSWQYRTLEALRTDPEIVRALGWAPSDVYDVIQDAHYERGFFGYLSISIRKYICGDKQFRDEINDQVDAAKKSGLNVRRLTPENVVASGGVALGALLVQHVPIMAYVGVPAVAAIVVIIYSIGIDAFCRWAADVDLRNGEVEGR